jgi:hypothetical protein
VAFLASGRTASAQLTQLGGATPVYTSAPQGTDAAFDPVHDVYLIVGGYTSVHAIFVNTSGVPVSGLIMISTEAGFHPRVKYSPDVNNGQGGFLVAYHAGSPTAVYAVLMSYPAGLISAPVQLGSIGSQSLQGPAVAYSTTSDLFLVAWTTFGATIDGRFVQPNGNVIGGGPFPIQDADGYRYQFPSAAWNPSTNEFGVAYAGVDGGPAFVAFRRITTAGQPMPRESFGFGGGPTTTNVDVNTATSNYLVAWYNGISTMGALLGSGGSVLASGLVLSEHAGQDNLGLAFNPVSQTFLVGGAHVIAEVVGAELNASGAPVTPATLLTTGQGPTTYWPRLTARTNAAQWNVFFAKGQATITDQIIATSSTNGGPAGSLGAPPPTSGGGSGSTSTSGGCTTPDPFASMGGGTCVNGGWLPPSGTSSGSGSSGGCTTPDPFASTGGGTCVNGGWLPSSGGTSSGTSGGCTTPDPFATMGGGTCVNGGWLPSGGGTSSGGGGLTSSGSSGGCTTPDPFASMGGGTCVNGGWILGGGGSGSSCTTPDPFAAFGGGTCVNGGWILGSGGSSGGSTSPPPSSCTTPDPFVIFGGGTCVNGGWLLIL